MQVAPSKNPSVEGRVGNIFWDKTIMTITVANHWQGYHEIRVGEGKLKRVGWDGRAIEIGRRNFRNEEKGSVFID